MTNHNSIKKDIKKLQQNKQFLAIMILLFVSLLFWITVSLISSQTTEKVSSELKLISKQLTPVIDSSIFQAISEKKEYSEEELSGFTIYKVITSRDGRTETVVPIEVTIDDLEPQEQTLKEKSTKSLLEDIVTENEATASGQPTSEGEFETTNPSPTPEASPEFSDPEQSSLGSQL